MFTGTSFLIEDVACPVDKLADMTVDLVEMFEKYKYKDASCFGHALEGNLHLVFSQVHAWAHPTATVSDSTYHIESDDCSGRSLQVLCRCRRGVVCGHAGFQDP